MTYEKAFEIYTMSEQYSDRYFLEPSDIDEAREKVYEACLKSDKYRWHDLRKNPKDLPRNLDKSVMYTCVHENHLYDPEYPAYYFNIEREEFGFWRNVFDDATLGFCVFDTLSDLGYERVIAWREIEPFKAG